MENPFESELKKLFDDFVGSIDIPELKGIIKPNPVPPRTEPEKPKTEKKSTETTAEKPKTNLNCFINFDSSDFTALNSENKQYFGKISISYVPDEKTVSAVQAQKILSAYTNTQKLPENAVSEILETIKSTISPKYLEVHGDFGNYGKIYDTYGKEGTKWASMAWERLSHYNLK